MDTRDIITTLNGLIDTCRDGEQGLRACADNLTDAQIKLTMQQRAQECAASAAQLQELVLKLGGTPPAGSSLAGALHRRWVDIKAAVTGRDNVSVLAECERGEDVALNDYRAALDHALPEQVRAVIEQQYQGVLRHHAQVKNLRDSAQAAANLMKHP